MKAECIHTFGGPEVLKLEDLPKPKPKDNELLVRVQAAGVNPVDWKFREGRLGMQPLPSIAGTDFAGVVEAVGPAVQNFRTGDPVFGEVADESGSYAEYAIAPATQVARKPTSLDPVQAAALPIASLTAWQALFDKADLQPGQRVLIHAAAGGVGGFAVQFAHWKGAYVIGTASASNVAYVRLLGADEVIDYHTARFEQTLREIDVVLDTIGADTQERSLRVMKPGGVLVSLVQAPPEKLLQARGIRGVYMHADPTRADELARIADLVVSGQVKVNISTILPLNEAPRAQELSRTGHTRGKIVLRIE